MASGRPTLAEAVREAVDACSKTDRPDLLERLLAGMVEILMHPARPETEEETKTS